MYIAFTRREDLFSEGSIKDGKVRNHNKAQQFFIHFIIHNHLHVGFRSLYACSFFIAFNTFVWNCIIHIYSLITNKYGVLCR